MKLKSQKGVAGADVVFAITIIVIAMVVVSMLYVNTTLQSRNVNRTAGATRIATNILENIEKLDYDTVISNYTNNGTLVSDGIYSGYKSYTDITVYNTKIPNGYTVYIKANPVYGSHSSSAEQFDLVRDINLSVEFNIGRTKQAVDFKTSKVREMINEINPPNTDILVLQDLITPTSKNFFPVKYSSDASAYLLTTVDDEDWYDYASKRWAMIIISNNDESELFDSNGKLVDQSNHSKYVWVPRYFTSTDGTSFYKFAYLATNNQSINKSVLNSVAGNSSTLTYYSHSAVTDLSSVSIPAYFTSSGLLGQEVTGCWIITDNVPFVAPSKVLNSSIYGPCEVH